MYKFIILIAPLLYYNILTLISLIVFSCGFYSDEIDRIGYFNGSITFYVLFIIISVLSYYIVWKFLPTRYKIIDFRLRYKNEVFFISGLLLFYYAIPVVWYQPAFILGINRYEFTDLPYVYLFNIKLFLAILSFVWGAYNAQSNKKISRFALLWLSFIVISFCYGEKSSGVIDSLIYFFCGYYLYKNQDIKFKTFVWLFTLIISFPFILFMIQLFVINIPSNELSDAFLIRLARQGQVFWIGYEELINSNVYSSGNFDIFNYYTNGLNGMKLLMYTFMPINQFESHSGSLAAGYPGILFLVDNNIIVLVFMYIFFACMSILPYIVYFFIILRYKLHYLVLFFIVFSMTVHLKIFQSGNMHLLTNMKYIIFYSVILMIVFYTLMRKRKNKIELSNLNK